jgi:hypothetical protein
MVLVGYTSKVSSLVEDVGTGAVGLRFDAAGLPELTDAAASVIDRGADVRESHERLRERERANGTVLDRLADQLGT